MGLRKVGGQFHGFLEKGDGEPGVLGQLELNQTQEVMGFRIHGILLNGLLQLCFGLLKIPGLGGGQGLIVENGGLVAESRHRGHEEQHKKQDGDRLGKEA